MIVRELQDEIVTAVFSELLRAQKEHGETFNSMPEAFSVIWEEIEEANEEMQRVRQKANDVWLANRRDDADAFRMCASKTAAAATLLACEAVQVAGNVYEGAERRCSMVERQEWLNALTICPVCNAVMKRYTTSDVQGGAWVKCTNPECGPHGVLFMPM